MSSSVTDVLAVTLLLNGVSYAPRPRERRRLDPVVTGQLDRDDDLAEAQLVVGADLETNRAVLEDAEHLVRQQLGPHFLSRSA